LQRITIAERPHWREEAEALGFNFHTFDGEPYWDETAYYRFSLPQIETDLEAPTAELHDMCMDIVGRAVRDETYLQRLAIPERFWELIRSSYQRGDAHLYGRMDLAYDGTGPAKLLELNYDTPTSLYESGYFQWVWLQSRIDDGTLPQSTDQFNSVQEKLFEIFKKLERKLSRKMHFASVRESIEDRGTVQYLQDIAEQAGIRTQFIALEDVGVDSTGQFADKDEFPIEFIFKLYPWEFMFEDEFANYLQTSRTTWFEPPWKAILSNKGMLPLLWELHPEHPNLLPAFFEAANATPLQRGWVRKPLFSREGANIQIVTPQGETLSVDGPYADAPFIRQAFHALPKFGDAYTLIGSWVIGDEPAGIGIREDETLITKDTSRFLPHVIA
jgi:glutathionylspermidine synthase